MALTVSPPQTGRLTVQKVADYHLHLAAPRTIAPDIMDLADLKSHPVVGYIPDMIFDSALDYLGALAANGVQLASNSDRGSDRLTRFAEALITGLRAEITRLEAQIAGP